MKNYNIVSLHRRQKGGNGLRGNMSNYAGKFHPSGEKKNAERKVLHPIKQT